MGYIAKLGQQTRIGQSAIFAQFDPLVAELVDRSPSADKILLFRRGGSAATMQNPMK
jgi:hypothetical protein